MAIIGYIIAWILQIFVWLLFARVILSWIPVLAPQFTPSGPVAVVFELVFSITDPPIRLARKIVPSGPGIGGVRLDLGFLVVFIAVMILTRLNAFIFFR